MRMFEKVTTFAISLAIFWTTASYGQWDTVYVDQSRPAGGNGQSWVAAFNDLDTAISYRPDTNLVILCAQGTYYPKAAKGRFQRNSNRKFKLIGGYPSSSTNSSISNPELNKVILDGDIDRNDTVLIDSTHIVRGNNASTVLFLQGSGDSWISGLTIQHGDNDTGKGGGLHARGKTSIEKCDFFWNRAVSGGALFLKNECLVDNCKFSTNSSDSSGGAIFVNSGSSDEITINKSVFAKNWSQLNGGAINVLSGKIKIGSKSSFVANKAIQTGGAIFLCDTSRIVLLANEVLFERDSAFDCGVLSSSDNDSIYFDKCIFKENRAESYCAVSVQGDGWFRNCLICNNIAEGDNIISGIGYSNDPIIRECTISDNIIPSGGHILGYIKAISNSIVWNDSGDQILYCNDVNNSLIKDWSGGGDGNKADPPEFSMDPNGHYYRLKGGSPAINSGDTNTLNATSSDLAGNPRINEGRIDIGAYEHYNKIYVNKIAAGRNDGSTWGNAYTNLYDALNYAGDGDTIWVAKGVYNADYGTGYPWYYFEVPENVTMIGGFRGDEISISQRNWLSNITTLSGETKSVYFSNTILAAKRKSTIDGFRIIKGFESAFLINNSDSVIVRNCIIANNRTVDDRAGLDITSSDNVLIENCFFSDNIVTGPGSVSAAGMGAYNCNSLRIQNCVFTGNKQINTSNSSAAIFNKCTLSIANCTFSRNNNRTLIFDTSSVVFVNSIIWNDSTGPDTLIQLRKSNLYARYCDIRNGISGIKKNSSSTVTTGDGNFSLDPDFSDAAANKVNLTRTSPCIDRGDIIDTSGWGRDIEGNYRIINGKIDIGALEFQGVPVPEPPVILSTLNSFNIPANGTLVFNLNQKKSDSTGYYVFYSFRDISELTWQCLTSDSNVTVTISPDSNKLRISLSPGYRPGDRFSIRLRVADPEFTEAKSEKTVQFNVINLGFRICGLTVSQNDTGRDFEGYISVENTIDPVYLSRNRIYIGDTVHSSISKMQYLDGITLTESVVPASRGGSVDCGIYKFTFNATSLNVINGNGISTGKTLYEWATDSTSRYPGSIYYKNHKKIKFLFSVTNGLSDAKEITREIPVDFDAPLTTMMISENSAHRQKIEWEPFRESLTALTLYIIPQGDSAPSPDTIVFGATDLTRTEFIADSIQDSRNYKYVLLAKDKRGNTGESQVAKSTPSDYYTISGRVNSIKVPADSLSGVTLSLYKISEDKPKELIINKSVKLDSSFQFNRIPNGDYLIAIGELDHYYAMPVQDTVVINRKDVSGLTFDVSPEPVANYDAFRVEQLENTGDLKFTVKTNVLFSGEIPVKVLLHWEGGDSAVDTGSQEFNIAPALFSEVGDSDGSAVWSFIIPRKDIRDSILVRKGGFTDHVRYYNSRLMTSAFSYSIFRTAKWEYPVVKDNRILFAAQRFVIPAKPMVSEPKVSCNDARFLIRNITPGPDMKAHVKFERKFVSQVIDTEYSMPTLSRTEIHSGKDMIFCPFDWNYTSRYKADSLGRSFLSGYFIEPRSSDTGIARIGSGFNKSGSLWIPGDASKTTPYASWKIEVNSTASYWAWIFVDRKAEATTKVFISFGDINSGNKYTFKVDKGSSGWIPVSLLNDKSTDKINLSSGQIDVNLFYPDNDISVSAMALIKTFNIKKPKLSPELRDSIKPWNGLYYSKQAQGFNLNTNSLYTLKVWVNDRYGNISDTVYFDSIHTQQQYFKGKIAIHEEPGTGDLTFSLKQPVSNAEYLDSIIFRFDGREYVLPVQQTMNNTGPTQFQIPRSKLNDLINIDDFRRHTIYDSLFFVFSSDTSYSISTKINYQCNPCEFLKCGKIYAFLGSNGIYKATCTHDSTEYFTDTVQTARIPLSWPDGTIYHVASQEYRNVTEPVLNFTDTTSRSIRFSCSNLNTDTGGTIKEQMSGQLNVSWTPGSICEDTTKCSFQFGNRFTMRGNWISFVPSFEGSVNSNVGEWRVSGDNGTRHQWIDRFDGIRPRLGGEFYPDIGDSISPVKLMTDPGNVPSLSTGIYLTSTQASSSRTDTTQRFHLWALPSKANSFNNSSFYWGIDGNPDTVTIGNVYTNDSITPSWVRGPSVYLNEGNHTIDLYMKADGAGIAAIALSKDNAYPPIDRDSLSRWGDYGFYIDSQITELPSNKDITISWQAVDRFGNVSSVKQQMVPTKDFDVPIPGVVISPDMPLENGYYHSIYPSFTVSVNNNIPDSLTLQAILMYNNGAYSDSTSLLNITLIDTSAHIWSVSVDSSYPLSPFPDTGGITNTNSYAIRTRIIKNNGNAGDWTKLLFGVKADTSEIPPSVQILDSLYEPSALSFKFLRGVEVAGNRIIGDLEILFDFENSSGKKLVLEGAVIYTDTSMDSSNVIHERIDSISGGKIACYECDDYDYNCSRSSIFSFPYGRYTVEAFAESLSIQQYGSIKKIVSPVSRIRDDNGSYVRLISAAPSVPFTRYGIIDTCYSFTDRFFLKNVKKFSNIYDGFHIDACHVIFARDTATKTYSLMTSGECSACGPDLKFTVLSPRYLDEEFTVFDKLDNPLRITYTDSVQEYDIDFDSAGNYVSSSRSSDIHYCGWDLKLNSYAFNDYGVRLTGFSVGLHEETFPDDKNGGNRYVDQFNGALINGDPGFNDGALHLSGIAAAPGRNICSSNDYIFTAIDTINFVPEGGYDYKMVIPDTCTLAVPSYKNTSFNEGDTVKIRVMADSGFVLGADGLEKVRASGSFIRSIGKRDSINVFTINGILDVSYAARDFQLRISPNGTDSLFMLDESFFSNRSGQVYIAKGSIGFFSDFTINTLYAKKDDGVNYPVKPKQFDFLNIPSKGFDIFKTSSGSTAGIRVLLLAPGFGMHGLDSLMHSKGNTGCELDASIYNAGFDLDGNLTNLSGRIDLPENMMSCFGINGMEKIGQQIAKFKIKTLYLGFENDTADVFKIGADAAITLGPIFNKIGLEGEKISLSKLTAGYSNDWFLDEMHASAFPLPRLIGIGPKNFRKSEMDTSTDSINQQINNDAEKGINYLELYTGGNGFRFDYKRDENLTLDLNNWSLRITDKFPFKPLRGVSFLLSKFKFQKKLGTDGGEGKITEFEAAAEYIPPGGSVKFGDLEFYNTKFKLGCDNSDTVDNANNTTVNAYFSVQFDSLRVGDKIFQMTGGPGCKTEFKIYFDGNYDVQGCLVWRDTIGIVPWGQEHDPKIFIDPGTGGTEVSIKIKSGEGFSAGLRHVWLRSKEKIPAIDTILAVDVNQLSIQFKDKKFCLKKLDVSWWIYKKFIDNNAFKLVLNKIDFGYARGDREKWGDASNGDEQDLKNAFWMIAQPEMDFKLGDKCSLDVKPELGLVVNTKASDEEQRKLNVIWKVKGGFGCELGSLEFGAKFKICNDTIGFDTAFLDMSRLADHFDKEDMKDEFNKPNVTLGVDFYNVYWIKKNGKWHFIKDLGGESKDRFEHGKFSVVPRFKIEKSFNICGLIVNGTFNFSRLFSQPYPGIGYEDICLTSKRLGNNSIPLCMSLYLDGRKPFIHPEFDSPKKIPIRIPGIELTPEIQLGEAHMEFGVEQLPGSQEESWYFKGDATMNLKGAVDKVDVNVSFEKPSPPKNCTGIRYAKITIRMAKNCRIPIGSTPLYISGFEGAIYDGDYMPDGARACYIPSLPPGLKVEAAMFVELEDPELANGKVGFWVHLRQLNFGLNGEVEALKGIADADACLALYNNGQAFHGHFNIMIHMGLMAKGRFVIDIWKDETGGNFTADASAAIGLSRGALIKGKLIKIPRKDRWFLELLTKAGKFSNEKNGVATGLRFFGRSWGLGVIGGKFSIGNMGKFKLKQAPVMMPPLSPTPPVFSMMSPEAPDIPDMPLEPEAGSQIRYVNPGFKLEGGEVISFVAATDSSNFQWPEHVLRIIDADSKEMDLDEADYIPFEGQGDDTTKEYFVNDENTVARLWVNNRNYDSILVVMPDTIDPGVNQPHGGFEYLFFAGLKPARIESISATADDTLNTHQVTFNGKISNFRGRIRNLIRTDSMGIDDTLLRQKMKLKLYCSSISPRPADTAISDNYPYNYMEIPVSQFEGYDSSQLSLQDFSNVDYDSINDTLTVTNLKWNTDKTAPGKYALRAGVEVTDFVTEDGDGNKIILPLDKEDEAPVFKENPVVITYADTSHKVIINIVNNLPITKPAGFTATGSEADTNWAQMDERRSIFLRWHMDNNPSVHGYQISWYPSNVNDTLKDKLKRSTYIGKTDNYTITIPNLTANNSLYTDACDSAEGKAVLICDTIISSTIYSVQTDSAFAGAEPFIIVKADSSKDTVYFRHITDYDTTIVPESTIVTRPYRLCPTMIDTAYYKATAFDVIITPVQNTTDVVSDTDRVGLSYPAIKAEIHSDSADTIMNVALGVNKGSPRNRLKLSLKPPSLPVIVPLNEGTVVNGQISVLDRDTADSASRYGEVWAKVVNDSVSPGAMPKAGSFNNYFIVKEDSVIKTKVSIRPLEKNVTCKEMFESTCNKVKVDSGNGKYTDTTAFQACTFGCSPDTGDSAYKQLKLADPCHGEPDNLVVQRTPFDTYKMYLYAVNNGKRRNPVYDTSGGYSVYDSLLFSVVPPRPVLHGVSPYYVLKGRQDTLSLAVSDLWLDSTAASRPGIRVRWHDKYGTESSTIVDIANDPAIIKPMITGELKRDWKLESNAQWEVRLSTRFINIDTTGETELFISIVNRDKDVHNTDISCASDEFRVNYVYNPDSIECPDSYYDPDSPNASFLMDWIGNYPSDSLSPNDSMFIRFTELHDLDPEHYSVKLIWQDGTVFDTADITSFKIDYGGICIKLPDDLRISAAKIYEVSTRLIDSTVVPKCYEKTWSSKFSTVPAREYKIVKDGNGFQIKAVKGKEYRNLDLVRYAIGKVPTPAQVTIGYNHTSDPPQHVQMSQSNWVTAVIKRRSGQETTIMEWIDIENVPQLYDISGLPVADTFEAEPGEKFFIRSPSQAFYDENQTKPYHCYRFSDADSVLGDEVTMNADSRGPLTIYRWAQTQPGSGALTKQLEGYKTYNFTLKTYNKNEFTSIIIPSQRLLDAASDSVKEYPLLLRLDSTSAPGMDTLLATKSFHFRDALMQPLSFDIEHLDTMSHKANIWVKMPEIDPGTGNNIVHFVSGLKTDNPENVWSDYRAVWHSDGDSVLHDATGNGFDMPLYSTAVIQGIIDNSIRMLGQVDASFTGKNLISENDPGFTISSWIKLYNFPTAAKPLLKLVNRKGLVEGSIMLTADSGLALIIGSDTLRTISGAMEDSIWLNIAVTYDWYNTKGAAVIYINGLPVATKELINNDQRTDNIQRILIAGTSLNISIDELRIAPEAFNRNRISLDYFSQRQRNDFLKAPSGVTSVTSISKSEFRMVPGAAIGDKICTNRNWRLGTILPDLAGKQWLLMPWEDRLSTKDTLVTVHLNGPAMLYLLFDREYITKPSFLSSWTETGRTVGVNGPSGEYVSMNLYTMEIDSVSDIALGGPRSGGARGGELPWAVLMDFSQDNTGFRVSAKDYPFVRTGRVGNGELLFSDREHEIDSLPEALKNGILIQTPNAFRFSDSSSFMSFSVNRPATASILMDTAYKIWPSFIVDDKEWKSSDMRVTSGNKVLSVLQKRIRKSDNLNLLGGPHFGGGDGNRCSYSMILQPIDDNRIIITDNRVIVADSGALVYTDSLWHIIFINGELRGKKLIKTQQAKYDCTDSVYLKFSILRSCSVYIAIDENQSIPPGFITNDVKDGTVWDPTGFSIEISNHAKFRIYSKPLREGDYSFSCARYNSGSDDNTQNYFVIVDTSVINSKGDVNDSLPWTDLEKKVINMPEQLKGLEMEKDSSYIDYCRNRTYEFSQPVRIWLGVDPAFRISGTFLQYDSWEKTDLIIAVSGLPDRILWRKTFDPGTVTIPGVHCDFYQPGIMNPITIFEYLNAASRGLYGRNLKVTGFGDERRAQTGNYIIKNLDVVYSYEFQMSSRSWIMNVETRSATAQPGDTIKVLTLSGDGTVYKVDDTTTIRAENQFYLAELMPLMVAVDSVRVNAIDLRAQGIVRVAFKNNSTVSVNKPFVVILFEDRNGDFTYNSYDKRLGSITVNSIRAGESKLYQINLDDTLSFPNRTLFSFIDATEQIDEMDDWNNVGSSGTTCENYLRPVFVEEIGDSQMVGRWGNVDSLTSGLPAMRDSTIFCYIRDFNGDSLIDEDDTMCIVYTYNNRLYAVNALTHDSLFPSIFAGPSAVTKIKVEDFTNDGIPEIIAGNSLYGNDGVLIHDFSVYSTTPVPPVTLLSLDFDRDGERDTIIFDVADSCTLVRSGRDSTLLFVYPQSNWSGSIDPVTKSVLCDIHQGTYNCYDVNVSFPRFSVTLSDTVDLTVRVANAGAAGVNGVLVEMFADTLIGDSSLVNGIADLPSDLKLIGIGRTGKLGSNDYMDFQFHAVLPNSTKRIWSRVDGEKRFMECNERDNGLNIRIR